MISFSDHSPCMEVKGVLCVDFIYLFTFIKTVVYIFSLRFTIVMTEGLV